MGAQGWERNFLMFWGDLRATLACWHRLMLYVSLSLGQCWKKAAECEIKTVLLDCCDCYKSGKTQVLEHRLHLPCALRHWSYCTKNNNISKSNVVLLLKNHNYYLVRGNSQQEASDGKVDSCVMTKTCEGGKRSVDCAGKAVAIHGDWSYHTLTNKVIN